MPETEGSLTSLYRRFSYADVEWFPDGTLKPRLGMIMKLQNSASKGVHTVISQFNKQSQNNSHGFWWKLWFLLTRMSQDAA